MYGSFVCCSVESSTGGPKLSAGWFATAELMPQCVMEGEWDFVQLEPFVHQVGGHSTMLRYSDSTVCKMLIPREHQFYKTMPIDLKEFTPQFRGVIEVSCHEDGDGFISLVARPPPRPRSNSFTSSKQREDGSSTSSCVGATAASSTEGPGPEFPEKPIPRSSHMRRSYETTGFSHRFRVLRSGSVEIDGLPRCASESTLHSDDGDEGDEDVEPDVLALNHNTWSLRCHKEHLSRMLHNGQTDGANKFILLENLTWKMELPCILDLKMGTRQHGDDASEEKQRSQMNKCRATTSSNLGIRICGMQVYRTDTSKYICHNKYYGRRLDVDGVRDTLKQFLFDGYRFRQELVAPIIDRLRQLLAMLAKQATFRFYSSSLLIMYDAGSGRISCSPSPSDAAGPTRSVDNKLAMRWSSNGSTAGRQNRRELLPDATAHGRIDVRMIDFAHATHQGFLHDKTSHVGPDHGYMFGLQNLICLFENLLHCPADPNDDIASGSSVVN